MAKRMDGMYADRKQITQLILVSLIGYDKVIDYQSTRKPRMGASQPELMKYAT